MNNKKTHVLSGNHNKRIDTEKETNNARTAAYANIYKEIAGSKVSIPSEHAVEDAKQWVDNGSKL